MKILIKKTLLVLLSLSILAIAQHSQAAPKPRLISFWNKSDDLNKTPIDHKIWQGFLTRYVQKSEDGFNKVQYAKVSTTDKKHLNEYIKAMSGIAIRERSKAEQFAYWVNLYNAATVQLILDNYPVKSITKLGSGLFSFGPWDEKILTIEQQKISLNDIEHGILRPIWRDKRIHYVVNCASYGCPELPSKALTAANSEGILQQAEKNYIYHKRGFQINAETVTLSKIYDWYQKDFGNSAKDIVKYIKTFFPDEEDQERIDSWISLPSNRQKVEYQYDWNLNKL